MLLRIIKTYFNTLQFAKLLINDIFIKSQMIFSSNQMSSLKAVTAIADWTERCEPLAQPSPDC